MGYVVRKISGFPGSQEELLSPLLPQWIIGYQCIPGASLPNAHCGSSQESINSASFEHPSTDRTSTALTWQKSKRDFTEKSPCIVPPPSQVWEIARYHRESKPFSWSYFRNRQRAAILEVSTKDLQIPLNPQNNGILSILFSRIEERAHPSYSF